jgi:hypothetical protein
VGEGKYRANDQAKDFFHSCVNFENKDTAFFEYH